MTTAVTVVFAITWTWSAAAFTIGVFGPRSVRSVVVRVGTPVTAAASGLLVWSALANADESAAALIVLFPALAAPWLWHHGRLTAAAACWASLGFLAPIAAGWAGPFLAIPLAVASAALASTANAATTALPPAR